MPHEMVFSPTRVINGEYEFCCLRHIVCIHHSEHVRITRQDSMLEIPHPVHSGYMSALMTDNSTLSAKPMIIWGAAVCVTKGEMR